MADKYKERLLLAPAKINLGLEIVRRRSDGFHDINTVFAAIDLSDELVLRERSDGRITCRVVGNDALEDDERNLCVRAAMALRESVGSATAGIQIDLTKRIPMGAGLGGGSSDAAAVLRGATELWNVVAHEELLHHIALSLGSDVPFFLAGGVAQAGSRGENLVPLDIHLPYTILLVNPGIHVSTPWAYQAVGRTTERTASNLEDILRRGMDDPAILRAELVNDFEEPVFNSYPRLREIKEQLYQAGALYAVMSGSGSTMLGLFDSPTGAHAASRRFADDWTYLCRFIPSGSYVPQNSSSGSSF